MQYTVVLEEQAQISSTSQAGEGGAVQGLLGNSASLPATAFPMLKHRTKLLICFLLAEGQWEGVHCR